MLTFMAGEASTVALRSRPPPRRLAPRPRGRRRRCRLAGPACRRGKDKRYFLIGPRSEVKAPEAGHGLIVILPGGSGGADFHPFVKRIYKHAIPATYLVAQPVAVKWTEKQEIVWPTGKSRSERMKFHRGLRRRGAG